MQSAIGDALGESYVQIILATKTYGKKTNELYSTFQEMGYALEHHAFVINMKEDPNDEWELPTTQLALGSRMWEYWRPGAPMPEGLIKKITDKIEAVRASRPSTYEGKSVAADWMQLANENGRKYYYHTQTRRATFSDPR